MKILWASDHNLKSRPAGGAELTDYFMIEEGIRRGFQIDFILPLNFSSISLKDYDLVVLSNNSTFTSQQRDFILSHPKHIVYNHDAQGWLRIYRKRKDLFDKSILNVFLSPLHLRTFGKFANSVCIPPYIPLRFKNLNKNRKSNSVVYIGNLWSGLKGADNLYNFAYSHCELTFDFYFHRCEEYWKQKLSELDNVNLKGYIEHNKIHEIMNEYEYFIHLPGDIEAFGRATGEAFLSGCKIITNKLSGAFSYEWAKIYDYFREKTLSSQIEFWNAVEKSL